jgi:trehalose 6-phosphate synthase/phosphatase
MRLIIVSNRAPVNVIKENDGYRYKASPGGLATGLTAYVDRMKESNPEMEIIWIGWPGTTIPEDDEEKVKADVYKQFGTVSVFLSEEVMDKFYQGFCNKTIWPLFHYFPAYALYEKENWEQYISVNEIFCNTVLGVLQPDDVIWVHDYHLMLLPGMIRRAFPGATIGFFLHVPFPSYEIFRLLPSDWRKKIFEGLYGADLIGFHTHDYCTYFLRSTLRILGLQRHMGEVSYNNRLVKVDTFPMGIDYRKFHSHAFSKGVEKEKLKLKKNLSSYKIILSIDRQDYSKGILNRLRGYENFLESNPRWKQKVIMMMVVVPSRIGVESYQDIKSNIDGLVGRINGKFGTLEWMPIHYQYRSLSFDELVALYNSSDVALVTPLRDGMNLIAKEYLASRTNQKGVLIISEMAGAADELGESIIINPNNMEEISYSLLRALEMNASEQRRHLEVMQQRLMIYDVFKWADDFLTTLDGTKKKQLRLSAKILNSRTRQKMFALFNKSASRLLFLDYDGTLVPYADHPSQALPGKNLLKLLERLAAINNTEVIIVSGRDRNTLEEWFAHLPVHLVAEHGLLIKEKNKKWRLLKPVRKNWKKKIIPIMNLYAEKLPGAFVEEKEFSLVFHYRKSDPAFASLRVRELINHLVSFTSNIDVQVMHGNHALEMRNAGIDKGVAAMHWLSKIKKYPRFILSIGDDSTDEDLFRVMPRDSYSIKVGFQSSYAKYNLINSSEVTQLLHDMTEQREKLFSELNS